MRFLFQWLFNIVFYLIQSKGGFAIGAHSNCLFLNYFKTFLFPQSQRFALKVLEACIPIVDGTLLFDNSEGKHQFIADKQINKSFIGT